VVPIPARDRFLAWIYTGPVGHLYGTLADVAQLWIAYLSSRIQRRLRAYVGHGS
jgi:hypothetical protein